MAEEGRRFAPPHPCEELVHRELGGLEERSDDRAAVVPAVECTREIDAFFGGEALKRRPEPARLEDRPHVARHQLAAEVEDRAR